LAQCNKSRRGPNATKRLRGNIAFPLKVYA
jgi:hypothetical protein